MKLFWLGLGWLIGIYLGRFLTLPIWIWLLFAAGSFAVVFTPLQGSRHKTVGVSFGFILLAAGRSQASLPKLGPEHIGTYNDLPHQISIQGVVVDFPDRREYYTGLKVEVEELTSDELGFVLIQHGFALVRADKLVDWQYGDRIYVRGYLETPPEYENFSYRDYLARQNVFSLVRNAEVIRLAESQGNPFLEIIFHLRTRGLQTIQVLFPEPEASLLAGILLGIETGIHPKIQEAFNQTGTTHIIAISGFNITIIAVGVISLFRRWLGNRWGTVMAGLTIAVYTVLVGGDAAVVRAAIMGGISLYARQIGRQSHGLASLSACAILMTAFNPEILWDVGFQLSFAATLGLILYGEPLNQWLTNQLRKVLTRERAKQIGGPIYEFGLITLAAQLTTLPLTVLYFQRLPIISLLANPVILPFQPGLMVLGGIATILGLVWIPAGKLVAAIAWFFPAFTIRAVEFFSKLPFASYDLGAVSIFWVILYYVVLLGGTLLPRIPWPQAREHLKSVQENLPKTAVLLAMAFLVGWVWNGYMDRPDGKLHVFILEVEGGEAILIESPSDRFLLVNGGSSEIRLSEALGRYLPLRERRLDWLILSGSRDEQFRGLPGILHQINVLNVLASGQPKSLSHRKLLEGIHSHSIPLVLAETGHTLPLGDGASLSIQESGGFGACIEITYGRARFILLPGLDPELARSMDQAQVRPAVTAVLLADSGYLAVNPLEWLRKAQPLITLMSISPNSGPDRPAQPLLQSLPSPNLYRTDHHGTVHITTDGYSLWVDVERPGLP